MSETFSHHDACNVPWGGPGCGGQSEVPASRPAARQEGPEGETPLYHEVAESGPASEPMQTESPCLEDGPAGVLAWIDEAQASGRTWARNALAAVSVLATLLLLGILLGWLPR